MSQHGVTLLPPGPRRAAAGLARPRAALALRGSGVCSSCGRAAREPWAHQWDPSPSTPGWAGRGHAPSWSPWRLAALRGGLADGHFGLPPGNGSSGLPRAQIQPVPRVKLQDFTHLLNHRATCGLCNCTLLALTPGTPALSFARAPRQVEQSCATERVPATPLPVIGTVGCFGE